MSDLDDQELLDDIKALEDALALQSDNASISCMPTLVPNIVEADNISEEDLTGQASAESVFSLNQKLLSRLYIFRSEVNSILNDCCQKLATIQDRLKQQTKTASTSKVLITTAGIPYFKDKNYFGAGPNEDTKLKAMRNELQLVSLPKVRRWTPKDRNSLLKSIRQEAFSSTLGTSENTRHFDTSLESLVNGMLNPSANTCSKVPNGLRDIVGPLGAREFDWLKIAVVHFDGKHCAEECRVMWNVFLHPDINKGKWSKTEDAILKNVAEKFKFQDWDGIARQLNTNRSGYQCFIRFNTMRTIKDLTGRPWTPEECERLSQVVNKVRFGNFVPWGEVASCMFHRTKQQVYFRWKYSSAPHLKKGRFTVEEDKILLNAVQKYGVDFSKIATALFPHRSTIQLNDHYHTLLSRTNNSNVWTVNDDLKIVEFYNELGPDWSQIAKRFVDRSRTQVRHRYNALNKFLKRGISIANIPRRTKDETCILQEVRPNQVVYDKADEKDIDALLIQHFCCLRLPANSYEDKTNYSTSELKHIAQKLYKVLEYLGADLSIPNDLNDIPVSKTERQILRSLKEYSILHNDKTRRQNCVEKVRLKMFGSQNDNSEERRFVPSYPSELQLKKEDVVTKKIDYDLQTHNNFTVATSREFETPEIVTSYISDYEQFSGFDKVIHLLLCQTYTFKEKNAQRVCTTAVETYGRLDHSPNLCDKNSIVNDSVQMISPLSNVNTLHENGLKFMQHCKRVVTASRARADADKLFSSIHFEMCSGIIPDIATLAAFKNLFSLKEIFDIDIDGCPRTCKKVPPCQKANTLLKKRLMQLFKYPIGLSHTFVPEVFVEKIFLEDNNATPTKRKLVRSDNVRRKKVKVIKDK